jgi:hypothetical protein
MATFNPHSTDRLSASEIVQVLSSNIFITGSNRKKLEERLNHLQNQPQIDKDRSFTPDSNREKGFIPRRGKHFYSSDSFRVRTKKIEEKDIPKKIIQEDFPTFNGIATEEENSILKSSSTIAKTKAPLNFKKIVDDKVINNNWDQDSTELFVENDLVVDYKEIEKIYNLYAIDRIHLLYLDVSRKINILNQADSEMKKLFDYDGLCVQKEIMGYCSYAYIQIERIIALSKSCIKILNLWGQNEVGSPVGLEVRDKTDELQELIPKMQYILNPKFNTFVRDFNYIKRTFKEFVNAQNIDLLELIIGKSNELLVFLTTFDPIIDCEYHIEFKRKSEGNITPVGISKYGYHAFRDLTMRLYEEKEILGELDDKYITYLFNQSYQSPSGIILIQSSWDSFAMLPQNIWLRFTIVDDIPFAKGGVIVRNKPDGANILTTLITNPKLLIDTKEKIPICSLPVSICSLPNPINRWFNTRNKSFILSEEEYRGLPDNIKSSYLWEDCDKNIFYADTLFSELLEYDEGNEIIEPHMLDSFRRLVYDTS